MNKQLFLALALCLNYMCGYASTVTPILQEVASKSCNRCHKKNNLFAISAFSVTDLSQWYTINTPPYPAVTPLSLTRNKGFTRGHIKLTTTGIKICKSGDYRISFLIHLTNPTPATTAITPVFLVQNGVFVAGDVQIFGATAAIPYGIPVPIQIYGILKNVKAGTLLSLVASNGGGPEVVPIQVISWEMSAERICNPKQ